MIPLHDANPTRRIPIVTRLLLGVNVAVWLYIVSLSRQPEAVSAFYDRYAFDWTVFARAITEGAITIDTFVPLFAHMFVQAGWLHIIGNMLYLWIFGDNVEDAMGSVSFLVFYLLSGIAAAVGQGLLAPAPMVGASGAIAGVLGAYLVMYPTARVSTLIFLGIFITVVQLPAIVVIGLFIVIQVVEGLADLRLAVHPATQGIAYFAHASGFLAGILLLPLFRRTASSRRTRVGWS